MATLQRDIIDLEVRQESILCFVHVHKSSTAQRQVLHGRWGTVVTLGGNYFQKSALTPPGVYFFLSGSNKLPYSNYNF